MSKTPRYLTEEEKEISENIRANIIKLLELLSSSDKQRKYAEQVGDSVAITEMVCMWFDDQYSPDSIVFRYGFSHNELVSLELFNKFFDEIDEVIPSDNLNELLVDPKWQELMNKAKETVKRMKRWNLKTPHNKM